jgi:hypothetical protein
MNRIVSHRVVVSACVSAVIGTALLVRWPLPSQDPVLRLVAWHAPHLYEGLKWIRTGLLFSTPYVLISVTWSLAFIFAGNRTRDVRRSLLPPYPPSETRDDLFVILGELHHPRQVRRVEHPTWLTIPERGLYTGVLVVGAIGSGKTTACMYPIADQLFGFRSNDPTKRLGGLVLEVKGDFCAAVRDILRRHGRERDYVEVGLGGPFRYNPLYGSHQDAYALDYGINSLMLNLFGKGDDPFWAAAQTNLLKFIILLHQVVDDYVTLWDVYVSAIDPDRISRKLAEAERRFHAHERILIHPHDYVRVDELSTLSWSADPETGMLRTPRTPDAERIVATARVAHEIRASRTEDRDEQVRREQYESVERWFRHDWMRIEPKLRTSIVEGVSVFLSLSTIPLSERPSAPRANATTPSRMRKGASANPCRRSAS